MSKYYVYVHRYASGINKGKIFYVGKGTKSRYSRPSCRSLYWNRIVKKYGFIPEKVKFFDNEDCALTYEKILINIIGRDRLCNLTDGGDGVSGISDQLREKKSELISGYRHNLFDWREHAFIHEDGTLFVGYRYDFCSIYNISNVNAFRLVNFDRKIVKGWMNLENINLGNGFLPKHMVVVKRGRSAELKEKI